MLTSKKIFIGKNMKETSEKSEVTGRFIEMDNETYYMISNVNEMPPFFMSIVSDSNHWMFVSSNGGITAGRANADFALFPYYTDDKITESAEYTGSKSIFIIERNKTNFLWEPFSDRYSGIYKITRNLYKNIYGNKLIYEEINHDLDISFRYQWNSSNKFGFIKKSTLTNLAPDDIKVSVLDGLQNIMPYGISADLQNNTSCLADAYKRSELIKDTGIGIFALSAIIVDKAEPSEALKANIVWSIGLEQPTYLLSTTQLNSFRNGLPVYDEIDVKAEKGAYFINANLTLTSNENKTWITVANVNQNHSDIIKISHLIKTNTNLFQAIIDDIDLGTLNLVKLVGSSDGLQFSEDKLRNVRHFSNTLFNIMRGGIFDNNYQIEKWDFKKYISKANLEVYKSHEAFINSLPDKFDVRKLNKIASESNDKDFSRLCMEYLPLKFSRRHGDPSRPWNKFSINTINELDGSKILDYEGNWRDIFQNWEALAHSFPEFTENMIHKFLNASTFDGYNPYRITKDGFDWETIEPDNPWSYIGYWGDHQIIYLLKLLELFENHSPQKFNRLLNKQLFVYANVPYKIKTYDEILLNPKDTIIFDSKLNHKIQHKKSEIGADGALVYTQKSEIHHVSFMEKILATVLAKLSNFIPEAGIWMNTQRPEWNDANNALVGNGVSMVTLYYLRRFLKFFEKVLSSSKISEMQISEEMNIFFNKMVNAFENFENLLNGKINDAERKTMLDALGKAASNYRLNIYENSFTGKFSSINTDKIKRFISLSNQFLEHSIKANKRSDHLYHAYNLMTVNNDEITISHLSEMLEGQVAVLSSGFLSPMEVNNLLNSLKNSQLYRKDQNSYILYPNKELARFLEKNNIPAVSVEKSELLKQLVKKGNVKIIEQDIEGNFHFNGNLRNAGDLSKALDSLYSTEFASSVEENKSIILEIFEEVFNHKAFTGRSGTFFGYEGLGSIYWHMVSKLQLAVEECCHYAMNASENAEIVKNLKNHYHEINEGIGVHKTPALYGAFPTDPYSHTPQGKGVKQPGMTGQVKEDILSRFGELGIWVSDEQLGFFPQLIKKSEFLSSPQTFNYIDVNGNSKQIPVEANSLCFTYCQVPIIYHLSDKVKTEIIFTDFKTQQISGSVLDKNISRKIFERKGEIGYVKVHIVL